MTSSRKESALETPWSEHAESLPADLGTDAQSGLSGAEVRARRLEYGRNEIREPQKKGLLECLIDQFKSLVILLLAAAAIVSIAVGQLVEGAAIGIAIVVNTVIGFVIELKAARSMEALRRMSVVTARVRRDGEEKEIPSSKLVVGDVVVLEGGDIVSADMRLIEANKLQTDESAMTGESTPVAKGTRAVEPDTELAERTNMAFKGTHITRGSGVGVVTAVGRDTELGKISEMVEEAEKKGTPLEEKLDGLANKLIWITLAITAAIAATGILRGKDVLLMIETGVALAVAAIPEGLPIVATVSLAWGMMHMARKNALVNRLASVETLGATGVIGVDKTGTLTENRMTVSRICLPGRDVEIELEGGGGSARFVSDGRETDPSGDDELVRALSVAVLCNNASLGKSDGENDVSLGDPLEVALLRAGAAAGIYREALLEEKPEEKEIAFDSESSMMATYHREEKGLVVAVKGAPEAVLDSCSRIAGDGDDEELSDEDKRDWKRRNDELAEQGLRILALAEKRADGTDEPAHEDLVFLGLAAMVDPPAEGVAEAIEECRKAGIEIVMLTGDHPGTARHVAEELRLAGEGGYHVLRGKEIRRSAEDSEGLEDEILKARILARVDPRQKLDVIRAHQRTGHVVAMTGDGVNDAPALKAADIGIAMGRRGTQVAKEASDVVLKDDSFPTIVAAIQQGRVIFGNIRKFVLYLLSGNTAEIIAVGTAGLAGWSLPLLPLQILFLNFVLDVFPALALGAGRGSPEVMHDPPRAQDESILTGRHWLLVAIYGAIIAAVALGTMHGTQAWLGLSPREAQTAAFLSLAFGRLWHVYNMREPRSNPIDNELTRNAYLWGAIALSAALLVAAVYTPVVSEIMQLVPPGRAGWTVVLGASLVPLLLGQSLRINRIAE